VTSNRIFIPLALLLFSGCASLSTLQTPSTVPKGQTRFAIAAEAVGISSDGDSASAPQFEFAARYGLTDDIDAGVKLYVLGAEFGFKYQLLRGPLDVAVAPAASYFSIDTTIEDSAGQEADARVRVTYLHAPVLFGYDVNDRLTLGFGPKLVYIIASGTTTSTGATETITGDGLMLGGFFNVPFRVGNAFWIAPEINVYTPIGDAGGGLVWQGGLALLFGGDPPRAMP
jgi:hypothetical protein